MLQEQTYIVCVSRDVTESLTLEVSASSPECAEVKALKRAIEGPPDDWETCNVAPSAQDNNISWPEPKKNFHD